MMMIRDLIRQFDPFLDSALAFIPRAAIAIVLMLVALFMARWASGLAFRGLGKVRGMRSSAVSMIASTINFGCVLLGAMAVLNVLGLGQVVFSAIASLGVVGLMVGFALQDIIKQFVSGVLLLLSRPFEIGDSIKVGAHEGTVTELELRTTRLRTAGGDDVLIPNADVYLATVYNLSRYPKRRLAVPIQLPFADNLNQLRAQLLEEVRRIPGVEQSPSPSVVCTAVADQKVSAEVRFWVDGDAPDPDEVTTQVIVAANRVLAST